MKEGNKLSDKLENTTTTSPSETDITAETSGSQSAQSHNALLEPFSKDSRVSTCLWLAYFVLGIIITAVALIVQKQVDIAYSAGSLHMIVPIFLGIVAQKYVGLLGAVGVFFGVFRKRYPKYFLFYATVYTVVLLLAMIGVFLLNG